MTVLEEIVNLICRYKSVTTGAFTKLPGTASSGRLRYLDKSSWYYYTQNMNTTALLMKEIETMPESTAVELLDFAMFLKGKRTLSKQSSRIATKDAYGLFKGINTHFERDEDDRV